jgi:hypothetical protein
LVMSVSESWTPWKKGVKKIIPANKKWREKMRPDFSKCDCSYVIWSHHASWKNFDPCNSPSFYKLHAWKLSGASSSSSSMWEIRGSSSLSHSSQVSGFSQLPFQYRPLKDISQH